MILEPEDFKRANVKATQTVDIVQFADEAAIDPTYFEKPYYLVPGKRGAKPYVLLREALRKSGKVGIARVVIRTRESLAAVMVKGDALVLELLRCAHELTPAEEFDLPAGKDAPKVLAARAQDGRAAHRRDDRRLQARGVQGHLPRRAAGLHPAQVQGRGGRGGRRRGRGAAEQRGRHDGAAQEEPRAQARRHQAEAATADKSRNKPRKTTRPQRAGQAGPRRPPRATPRSRPSAARRPRERRPSGVARALPSQARLRRDPEPRGKRPQPRELGEFIVPSTPRAGRTTTCGSSSTAC